MNTKDYFNNAADSWDDRFQTPELLSFLRGFVPQFNLKPGQHVLDVGTGTGVLIPYLIRAIGNYGSITTIDFSEKMVQKCKAKYSHYKNVNINVGNIENATYPTESFEAVICFGVFPHLKNKEKALQNINRMLKPYGKLVIAHALSSEDLKSHHQKVSKHLAHATLPKEPEMVQMLQQTGFIETCIRDEPGSYLCIACKPSKP